MPGKLIHTNEIMVLLGDNWFAERSASQALEIVARRKKCTVINFMYMVMLTDIGGIGCIARSIVKINSLKCPGIIKNSKSEVGWQATSCMCV